MPHKPGHKKKTITGVEKKLRRREAGGGEAGSANVARAEESARNMPGFRPFTPGENIPGGGVDPTTGRTGETFKGTTKQLAAQRGVDVSKITSEGQQAQIDISNQQKEGQTVSEQTIQEIQNVTDPEEQSILSKFLFGPPASELRQDTIPLGLGAVTTVVGTGAKAIQTGRVGPTITQQFTKLAQTKEAAAALKAGKNFPTTGKEAINYVRTNKLKTLIGLAGSYFIIDSALLGPSELATWLSADNIGSGVAIQLRDIEFGFNQGTVNPEEMTAFYNQADFHLKNARTSIDELTSKNPQLWPHKERYLESNDINREALELSRARTGL